MPDLLEEAEVPAFKIAIFVSKGRSGLKVLKCVLENEVLANGLLYLIHVQSPLRRVPSALGGKFPVEQVHPEMVKNYKILRLLKSQKLLDQYRRICDKKKVETRICYSENDSVQKELVSQILKNGITKLVWEDSSQTLLSRALKKDSISAFVAKNAPDFCTLMVVNKGRLRLVKHATQTIAMQYSSHSSENVSRASETTFENVDAFEECSRESIDMQDGERSTWSGILDDTSNSQWNSLDFSQTSSQWAGKCNNAVDYNPPVGVIIRELSDYTDCEPQTSFFTEARSSEASISGELVPEALLPIHKDCLMGSSLVASECVVLLLQNQVVEARLRAEKDQKQAEWQIKKLEAMLTSAHKQVMEHKKHRVEALRRAKWAMQQATEDTARCREALEVAIKDREEVNKRLAEEVTRHKETLLELAMQKCTIDAYAQEAACAKDHAEAERRRCEETLVKLEDMVMKVETEYQLRRDAEEKASQEAFARLTEGYHEYSFQELQFATENFSEDNKLGEGAYGPVYKGKLRHTMVAIKVLEQDSLHGCQQFQKEVELLSRIRHPHMLMLIGACHERRCIVYEYMENGSLQDRLNCKDGTPPLPWYIRFRVCLEVARALLFLYYQPKPIVYCGLTSANILLDSHLVSKIGDVGLAKVLPPFDKASGPIRTLDYTGPNDQHAGIESCDCVVNALGIIMLQLLTGRPAAGVTNAVKEAERNGNLVKIFDRSAGNWPLEEATKLVRISLQCTTVSRERAKLEDVLPVLERIQAAAGVAAANTTCINKPASSCTRPIIPSVFFCPILKEIMDDPCIAADGFTYEYDAIRVWLQANNTSPMTNLRLDHKTLTPNYTMRSAINDWRNNCFI